MVSTDLSQSDVEPVSGPESTAGAVFDDTATRYDDLESHSSRAEPDGAESTPAFGAAFGDLLMIPWVDLVANPDNIRSHSAPNPGLVANLKADGIAGLLQPLIVVEHPEQPGYLVLDGGDRLASVEEAAQTRPDLTHVPAIFRPDLADKATQIVTMLRTGVHRRALTSVEEAHGVEQLALEGLSGRAIIQRTGLKRDQVKDARTVAKLRSDTAEKVTRRSLDLHQAAVVQEFEDDEPAVAQLLDAAERGPIAFDKKAAEVRAERREAAQRAARIAELTAAGVPVIDSDVLQASGTRAARVSALLHDGEPLTGDNHVGCPGSAITFDRVYDGYQETACCLDWQKYGHTNRYGPNRPSGGPMSDEQKAERQLVIANNKAMRAANDVRRTWLAELLKRVKLPGAARYVAETLVSRPQFVARWMQKDAPLLEELLGTSDGGGGRAVIPPSANDARATVYAFAAIAAAHEHEISHDTWRELNRDAARWLAHLAALGYDLAEVEQRVIDRAGAADGSAEPDGTEPESGVETSAEAGDPETITEPSVGDDEQEQQL
ncbi:ParB/RepB/Spo0J family partition protein [Cryptosporangium aurantiacum]|uniref:Chromosome partitioning protein, ParB family n=1 Tax=Cryptosporangium aurantiacum TaxID=134849 RepID=A0A1M7PQX5_9ACTN|nr:ParB N-terminal domain-containing protein [Cryptosporangium aurantiacum]SHN19715.1 chromosome partitioning protein, ParB family [Cryptosporangium aurantiacum]